MKKANILYSSLLLLLGGSLCANKASAKDLEDLLVDKGVITRSEAAGTNSGTPAKIYWKDGTRLEFPSEGITTKINAFLQTRYVFTDKPDGQANTSSFDINKARIIVSGTALNEEFSYEVEGDFVGAKADGLKTTSLKNALIAWKACDSTTLKMGQFKPALSKQFSVSDHLLQFADRSVASDYFSIDREVGLGASMDLPDANLVLGAAIFNGESDGEGINRSGVDTKHTAVVNLRWNPVGKMNIKEEGDIDYSDEAAVSFGAAYAASATNQDLGVGLEKANYNRVSVDGNYKQQGMSLHGEFYVEDESFDVSSDAEATPLGFYIQGGYFFDPKTVEFVARYAMVDCDEGMAPGSCSGNDSINEAAAGFNYHWWRHNLKAHLGYSISSQNPVETGVSDKNTNKWILQLTSYF